MRNTERRICLDFSGKAREGRSLPGRKGGDAGGRGGLVVHHFTDLHNRGLVLNGENGQAPEGRLAKLTEFRKIRSEKLPNEWGRLFLNGGDDHCGGWLDGFWGAEGKDPAYELLDAAGVDALTLGNHDFDLGAEVCARSLGGRGERNFSVVVTNMTEDGALAKVAEPALIYDFDGLTVGVLALTRSRQRTATELGLTDALEALQFWLPRMEAECDVVVLLSHLGLFSDMTPDPAPTDADLLEWLGARASACPLLTLGAHTHRVVPPVGEETGGKGIYLQPGDKGKFLAEAIVYPQTEAWHGENLAVPPDMAEAPELAEVTARTLERAEKRRADWGSVSFSVRALATERMGLDCYAGESPHLNLLTDVLADSFSIPTGGGPEVVALCSWSLGENRLSGEVDVFDWCRALPYPSRLALLDVPWDRLPDLLRTNAKRLLLEPGRWKRRGMMHFDWRLRQRVRLSSSAAEPGLEALSVSYRGHEWSPGAFANIRLVTTDFVTSGSGGYDEFFAEAGIPLGSLSVQVMDEPFRERFLTMCRRLRTRLASYGHKDGRLTVER